MTEGPPPLPDRPTVRDAATLILVRDAATRPRILMGQRGADAAFMPMKFVFPGGAVDAKDAAVPLSRPLDSATRAALAEQSAVSPEAIASAAIRELWEETGLALGDTAPWPIDPPRGWRSFAAAGFAPAGAPLSCIFRAVTPAGHPRRFDARFLLARAADLGTDPDDFSRAEDELACLQWIPLDAARDLDLPFITQVVLAHLAALLDGVAVPASVPFFRNGDEAQHVTWLDGARPLDGRRPPVGAAARPLRPRGRG